MAKVSIRQREDRGDWLARWPEYRVVDGRRKRVQPSKSFPTKAAAEAFKRQADILLAETGRVDLDAMHVRHTTSLVEIASDFVLAGRTQSTQRFRQSVMNAFLGFMGHDTAVDELDRQALEEFFQDRPREGRKAQTAYRYLKTVEQLWGWAYGKPDVYRGVPQPIRVSGEGEKVALPDTTPGRAPTWAECDRMIAQLTGIRRKRVRRTAILQRYTGARVSQVLHLTVGDIDLAQDAIRFRASAKGAKGHATRWLPLHAGLRELVTSWEDVPWSDRGALLVPSLRSGKARGDMARPFERAWKLAGVPEECWGRGHGEVIEDRAKGRATHAFRAAVKAHLERRGSKVDPWVVDLILDHRGDGTASAYRARARPGQGDTWLRMVDAIASIPAIGVEADNVVSIAR